MSKYVQCPKCRSMNRDVDTKCYQCDEPLTPSLSDTQTNSSQDVPDIQKANDVKVPSYAYKMPKQDRESTIIHGLRSGALAGAITGTLCGIFCSAFGSMFASAVISNLAGIGIAGIVIFFIVLVSDVVYGTIIGAILGSMNVLCYQYDCIKIGSLAGIIVGIITALTGLGGFSGIIGGAAHGALLGYLASFVERRIFRKQYAEL